MSEITAGELKDVLKQIPDNYTILIQLDNDYPIQIVGIGYRGSLKHQGGDLIFNTRRIIKE